MYVCIHSLEKKNRFCGIIVAGTSQVYIFLLSFRFQRKMDGDSVHSLSLSVGTPEHAHVVSPLGMGVQLVRIGTGQDGTEQRWAVRNWTRWNMTRGTGQ